MQYAALHCVEPLGNDMPDLAASQRQVRRRGGCAACVHGLYEASYIIDKSSVQRASVTPQAGEQCEQNRRHTVGAHFLVSLRKYVSVSVSCTVTCTCDLYKPAWAPTLLSPQATAHRVSIVRMRALLACTVAFLWLPIPAHHRHAQPQQTLTHVTGCVYGGQSAP
jgi:hypothetical protein